MKYCIQTIAICFLLLMINVVPSKAQAPHPIKWSFSVEKREVDAILSLKATIESPWHLYSQNIGAGGPIPTSFKFTPSSDYELIGKVNEPDAVVFHDPNFDMDLKTFDINVTFTQKIKLKNNKDFSVKGTLEFMACNCWF